MFRVKIYCVIVIQVDLDYVGSVIIDQDLFDVVDILVNEKVDIWNIINGNCLYIYVLSGLCGSGVIGINGVVVYLMCFGDMVIIVVFGNFFEEEVWMLELKVVLVDVKNCLLEL